MNTSALNPADLLTGTANRLIIQATLKPVAGKTRFQPAGFPEIGHVIYDTPDGRKICIVDSAASMANHLETVCVNPFDQTLVAELSGLPYVQCVTGDNKDKLVVTSLSEGHRLASSYFLEGRRLGSNNEPAEKTFGEELRDDPKNFGLRNLEKKTHPLPEQWWNVFRTIFRYDPNSLVHGIMFPAFGIKLPRILTAALEAFNAARVATSGVKFDKLGKTNSGQPIFSKDEETSSEIRATFVIDLSLIRSFGRKDDKGLNAKQKELLLGLALWKIGRLLGSSFRFRSECDLELDTLTIDGVDSNVSSLNIAIGDLINAAYSDQNQRITKVYWEADALFKPAKDEKASANSDASDNDEASSDENSDEE